MLAVQEGFLARSEYIFHLLSLIPSIKFNYYKKCADISRAETIPFKQNDQKKSHAHTHTHGTRKDDLQQLQRKLFSILWKKITQKNLMAKIKYQNYI